MAQTLEMKIAERAAKLRAQPSSAPGEGEASATSVAPGPPRLDANEALDILTAIANKEPETKKGGKGKGKGKGDHVKAEGRPKTEGKTEGKGKSKGKGSGDTPKLTVEAMRVANSSIRAATDFERLIFAICERADTSGKIFDPLTDRALGDACRSHWHQLKLRPAVPNQAKSTPPAKGEAAQKPKKEKEGQPAAKAAEKVDKSAIGKRIDQWKNMFPSPALAFHNGIPKEIRVTDQEMDALRRQQMTEVYDSLVAKKATKVLEHLDSAVEVYVADQKAIATADAYRGPADSDGKATGYWPSHLNLTEKNAEGHKNLIKDDPVAAHVSANREALNQLVQEHFPGAKVRNAADRVRRAYVILNEASKQKQGHPSVVATSKAAGKLYEVGAAARKRASAVFDVSKDPYVKRLGEVLSTPEAIDMGAPSAELLQRALEREQPSLTPCHTSLVKYGRADPLVLGLISPPDRAVELFKELLNDWCGAPDFVDRGPMEGNCFDILASYFDWKKAAPKQSPDVQAVVEEEEEEEGKEV